jgi:CheY-like chemotaxis protein
MVQLTAPPVTRRGTDYILIAIANTSRASAVRALALEFCPNVVVVRDGQEAVLHMDRSGAPRLLVSDLSLPRVDGFGVLRHMRAAPSGARGAAIVVSSHAWFRTAAGKVAV